jgi:hypothetical protein
MGMSKGTEIFDPVVCSMVDQLGVGEALDLKTIKILVQSLWDLDWDTESESHFWEHPVIGKILGNTFEEW